MYLICQRPRQTIILNNSPRTKKSTRVTWEPQYIITFVEIIVFKVLSNIDLHNFVSLDAVSFWRKKTFYVTYFFSVLRELT